MNGETYQSFSFPLVEFSKDIGLQNNQHNRKQLVHFFHELPGFVLGDWFSDEEFESLAAFPVVKVRHQQPNNFRTKLIVKISVAEEVFSSWKYPFYFPKDFYRYSNIDDGRVKLEILKSIASQVSIKKLFYIAHFLSTLTAISNQRKTFIKKNIIKQFQSLEKESFIDSQLTLHREDKTFKTITTQELTLLEINQTQIIVFYETNKYFK